MTVQELIEHLQQLPPSAMTAQVWYPCFVPDRSNEGEEELCTVETVEYDRGAVVIE